MATLADVSAEVAAGRRADLLARVLDAGSDFLMVAERNGAISYVNDAAQQTLGVRGSSAEGSPSFLMDVLQPESYEIFREVVEPTLAREQIWRGELNFHSWSGAVDPGVGAVPGPREPSRRHRVRSRRWPATSPT